MTYFKAPEIPEAIAKQIRVKFEVKGTPLLEPFYPEKTDHVIEAIKQRDGYWLETLDKGNPPTMTWREYNEKWIGYSPEYFAEEQGIAVSELDEEADPDLVFEFWLHNPAPTETPSGHVYFLLDGLNLGPTSVVLDEINLDHYLGYLTFRQGQCPGNDLFSVEVSSAPALSALQWNLTEMSMGIKIVLS